MIELHGATTLTKDDGGSKGRVLPPAKIAGRLGVLQMARDIRLVRYYLLRTDLDRVISRLALVAPAPLVLGILECKTGLSLVEGCLEFAILLLHAGGSFLNDL